MPNPEMLRAKPSGFLTFVWALFFFFIFALLVAIWVRASGAHETVDDKRAAVRKTKLADLQKADNEKLAGTGWVDEAKGIVHIPIAEARRLVIADLKGKKPTMSQVKVEPPLPMPPPFDPNATEPPPAALPSSPQGADTLRFDLPGPGAVAPSVPVPAAPAPGTAAPSGASANVVPAPARPPLINSTTPK